MQLKQLLILILGDVKWTPPLWMKGIYNFISRHIKWFIVSLIALIILGVIAYQLNQSPAEIKIGATFEPINLEAYIEKKAKPSPLTIHFIYDYSNLNVGDVYPKGEPAVAPIDLIGKKLEVGIELFPAKAGVWEWLDDNSLRFIPETEWPAGTDYRLTFNQGVFADNTELSKQITRAETHFSTPKLVTKIKDLKFYQDPQDSSVRRVVATAVFSHPIDKVSFESALLMGMQGKNADELNNIEPHDFSVSYHKSLREAYIQSSPITLPKKTSYMKLVINKDVTSVLGGKGLEDKINEKVVVPDVFSYLKISSFTNIIHNNKNEPEQILTIEFTDDIAENELLEKLSLYKLPENFSYSDKNSVDEKVLSSSEKLVKALIPNERDSSKVFNFRLDVNENDRVYFHIDEKLKSENGFIHKLPYFATVYAPSYPKEVNITGEGSVLTYSGNHQIGISSRGVYSLKMSVGKLLANKVNHLVSQTRGDISNPIFNNWKFDENDLVEYQHKSQKLRKLHPKQENYSSFDLTEYLPDDNDRFGLFFLNVVGMDAKEQDELASDKRLILITDLGLIVKDNVDQSHHVFVQSIQNGLPVAGASVELLGRNGQAISSGVTDAQGHVLLPSTKSLVNEKAPTVYVVKTENDMSFIPFDRSERQMNLSKFDIGGIRSQDLQSNSLNGFLFSDRGIYRPGETVNLGIVVKQGNLSNIENIPLELVIRGPKNKELKAHRYQLPVKGFSDFQFSTELSTDTGQYKASLYVIRNNDNRKYRARQIGQTSFKVEEFQPDTMKIISQLGHNNQDEKTEKIAWHNAFNLNALVSLENLFGTPAQDRKIIAKTIINPHMFHFDEYESYQFTEIGIDDSKSTLKLNKSLPEKRTNADGEVNYAIDLSEFVSGTYQLDFDVEGFEPSGGRSVKAFNSILFSPLKRIVGYKANGKLDYIAANSERKIHFIAIDNTLQTQAETGLTLKLLEINAISTLVKQANGTYKYQTIKKEVPVMEESISWPKHGFDYMVDSSKPGDFVIEIYDKSNQRLSRAYFSVAGFADLSGKIDKDSELQLKLDKTSYFNGETIKMSIKAPFVGGGLISIETDKVHHFKWFKTTQESSVQDIVLPEGIEGTAYINVAFVRDIGSKEIFSSPLSYAVQPFSIDKSKRRVDIELSVDKIVRPGKAMDIKFKTNKQSRVAIFAVDEGILQVANYETPDPLSHYLKKRALDVKTSQILDLILPDFNIVKELSASGGGTRARAMLAKNLNPFARKLDRPAVYWSGIYDASSEEQKIQFDVPSTFSGTLRVMAVAVSDSSVGAHSESTLVRGPFVISPNVLTTAAPNDEFDVTVGVANIIEGSGKQAEITLSLTSTEHLQVLGSTKKTLIVDEGSEGKATFRVKAKHVLGAAEITFTAEHKNESSYRTAGLSIRPASHYRTEFYGGFSDKKTFDVSIDKHLNPVLAKQTISASSSPLLVVDGLTAYLDSYPHGCTEQIVSKVFPIVGLLSHPAYAPHFPKVKDQFDYLINQLRSRQMADGGFSFWPRSNSTSVYPSIYAMHFLIEARDYGYPVPKDMLERAKSFLDVYLQRRSDTTLVGLRNRANAIYLLTRMGVVTSNYLVDLEETMLKKEHKDWQTDILSSYMAATFKLLQNNDDANRLIKRYQLGQPKQYELDDFHSLLALDSQHIYLLAKHFESEAKKIEQAKVLKLTDLIYSGEYNTISSAYSILALGAYSKLVFTQENEQGIQFSAFNQQQEKTVLDALLKPFPEASYSTNIKKISVSAKTPVFYTNVQTGFDNKPTTKAIKQGIELYREFVDDEGNVLTKFTQGQEITVRLRVRSLAKKVLNNIALVDLLPGGFEIIRNSVPRTAINWAADYVDIREDRLIYYASFDKQTTEISYQVKLTAAGTFFVPSASAESMYDRSIKALTPAGEITVSASE